MKTIPFSSPDIQNSDLKLVDSVIRSGWLAHGQYSKKLEEIFCEYTGAKYATTISNCTAGLHLSCIVSGIGPGDEVIVPAQTHVATAHAVEYTGAKAVFADVDPLSGNILISEIEAKLNPFTKGIIPVHLAGQPCKMDEIKRLSEKYNLVIIEDCAHALGTIFKGIHVGNFGVSGCFSFYPTKQITTGEGGMIVTNNKNFFEKVKKLKAFGIDTNPDQRTIPGIYDVKGLGYNFRMTDFQAALGIGQMERYVENVCGRRKNAIKYCKNLKDIDHIAYTEYSDENSYFLFQVILDKSINRNQTMLGLKEKGIGVSIHYATSVPLMTFYKEKYGFGKTDFPNALNYGNQSISLPVHQKLTNGDIEYICENLADIIINSKR